MRKPETTKTIAGLLTKSLASNDSQQVWLALKQILKGQNVSAIARSAGMRRDTLYRSFSGKVDPNLSRVLKLLAALHIRLVATPLVQRARRSQPRQVWIYVDVSRQVGDKKRCSQAKIVRTIGLPNTIRKGLRSGIL
jgi:probable addiction module antidote protein